MNLQITPDAEPESGKHFRRVGSALYVFALPPDRNWDLGLAHPLRDARARGMKSLGDRGALISSIVSEYERTIYRKLQEKYPDVCSADDIEELVDPVDAIDLYSDVVKTAMEWPTCYSSINTLANYLSFSWRDTLPSGAASIEWFHRWVELRDFAIRQRILNYVEDDCRGTRVLRDARGSLTVRPGGTV